MMAAFRNKKRKTKKSSEEKKGKYTSVGATAFTTIGITAHNFCHYLCLAVIAALSALGIASAGMPLMFLENYAVYFWGMGLAFLAISFYLLYNKPYCISKKAIMANTGLLIIAVPLKLGAVSYGLWIAGGMIVAASAYIYLREKLIQKRNR